MPRSSKALPTIPVKHALIRKVLNLSSPLEAKLRAYIAYYTEQQGLKPAQAPTDADTIVALLENFLQRDIAFNLHLRGKIAPSRRARAVVADATETEPLLEGGAR